MKKKEFFFDIRQIGNMAKEKNRIFKSKELFYYVFLCPVPPYLKVFGLQ